MSEWKDIETAPKDGTHVLVADSGVVGEAFFERHDGLWYWSGNHWTDAHDGSLGLPGPTHWQPLPEAP